MSLQLPTSFSEQYRSTIEMLLQQEGSRFRGKVREVTQTGKTQFFEQLGATAAVKRTSRHADTPRVDSKHERRQVTLNDYDWSDLIDTLDDNKMIISPQASYVQSALMAMGRAQDEEVIEAATGTAFADTTGTSTIAAVALPTSQKVAVDFDVPATNTGLTLGKLIGTKSILGKNEVPRGTRLYFAYRQQQLDDLLSSVDQVGNSDYAAVKALVDGEVNYFMGFEFVKTELLANSGADITTCFAWAFPGLLLSLGQDMKARISERDDKNYSTQAYVNMTIGATRMQEKMVVETLCDESP